MQPGAMPDDPVRGVEMAKRICSVDGCEKPLHSSKFCNAHHSRWRRYGDPLVRRKMTWMPWEQRLLASFATPSDGCWVWAGSITSEGYGSFYRGKNLKAHRVVYEFLVGPIPDGLTIDHLCRNKPCVNPAHLEVVTRAENIARRNRDVAGRNRRERAA